MHLNRFLLRFSALFMLNYHYRYFPSYIFLFQIQKGATMKKKFVGFGFGPIQSGLMLFEAVRSGHFDDYAIVEVDKHLVDAVRANGNKVSINIAYTDRIETAAISGFTIATPNEPNDLPLIEKAINEADEMATAIPSVQFYSSAATGLSQLCLRETSIPISRKYFTHQRITTTLQRFSWKRWLNKIRIVNQRPFRSSIR